MKTLFERSRENWQKKWPFVLYRKPESSDLQGLFQMDEKHYSSAELTAAGFVLAPFETGNPIFIPEQFSERFSEKLESSNSSIDGLNADFCAGKLAYQAVVAKAVEAMNEGQFQKVVLSRCESIAAPNFNFETTLMAMLSRYRSAFVYCFYHPLTGMWLGATPEQLLKINDNHFETIALAGTQKFEGDLEVAWGEKEKNEQQIVTEFILENLEQFSSDIAFSSPYTQQAGNLLHLKTDISGSLNSNSGLQEMVEILHPTPAVCGLPKGQALDFIRKFEGYDRKYYSGYLGEIHVGTKLGKKKSDLFVNLRCMEVDSENINIYVGCGITKASDPKKEYEETVHKTMTLKSILKVNV